MLADFIMKSAFCFERLGWVFSIPFEYHYKLSYYMRLSSDIMLRERILEEGIMII